LETFDAHWNMSSDVKVYVTLVIDPLNFYARIGDGTVYTWH